MKSKYMNAAIITIVAVILFLAAKQLMGFQFGLRTYWPVFAVLYLVINYFNGMKNAGKSS